jgi:hypothetical protein
MASGSRLVSLLRRAVSSPAVRRAARDLAERAVQGATGTQKTDRKRQQGGAGQQPRPSANAPAGAGATTSKDAEHAALRDRDTSAPAPTLRYEPSADGDADPGEIVWSWVAFEEDITQGKDRPVLVLALEDAQVGGTDGSGTVVVALMLTSKDRGAGTHQDSRGATWVDVGTGDWDSQGRTCPVTGTRGWARRCGASTVGEIGIGSVPLVPLATADGTQDTPLTC